MMIWQWIIVVFSVGTFALLSGSLNETSADEVIWDSRFTSTTSTKSSDLPEPLTPVEAPTELPAPAAASSAPVELGASRMIEGFEYAEDPPEDEEARPLDFNPNLVFSFIPGGGDDFGLFGVESRRRPTKSFKDAAVSMTEPGWGVTWLSGPQSTDLPPQLYQFTIPFDIETNVNEDWTYSLLLTIGWFTDGENRRPEMFRVLGTAAIYYRIDDSLRAAAGLLYLDRDDIAALPLVGLVIGGDESPVRYELIFPRPRVMWRYSESEASSRWFYVLGELGGGSWAIKRTDRTPDVLTYRDLRVLAGFEARGRKGHRAAFEAGWVFERAIESRTGRGDYDPPNAFITRMWLEY